MPGRRRPSRGPPTSIEYEAVNADSCGRVSIHRLATTRGGRTGIVCHAGPLNHALDVSEAREAGHEPAVAEAPLLDIAAVDIFHEGRALEDLVHALDSLRNRSARIDEGGHANIKLG